MLFYGKMDCELRIVSNVELRRSWSVLRFYLTGFRPHRLDSGFFLRAAGLKLVDFV